jgi:hypothetical protein
MPEEQWLFDKLNQEQRRSAAVCPPLQRHSKAIAT